MTHVLVARPNPVFDPKKSVTSVTSVTEARSLLGRRKRLGEAHAAATSPQLPPSGADQDKVAIGGKLKTLAVLGIQPIGDACDACDAHHPIRLAEGAHHWSAPVRRRLWT